ncbi:MAG TPA: hypothetical protein VE623_11525 [Acidimicrobiales bacterium]|nr:hypothetical protein [Acidimicrobiales bacterium]
MAVDLAGGDHHWLDWLEGWLGRLPIPFAWLAGPDRRLHLARPHGLDPIRVVMA